MMVEQKTSEKGKRMVLIAKSLVVDGSLDDMSVVKVLMVRRYRPTHAESHDKWELPGGKVEFGENPLDTAKRECEEESGFITHPHYLLGRVHSHLWEHPDRTSHVIVMCYVSSLLGGVASTKDSGVSEVAWFTLEEIKNMKEEEFIPGTIEFLETIW